MKERSTHAVVGLCGNDSTMTLGLGHDSSQALMSPSKKSSPGSGAPSARRRRRRALQRAPAGRPRRRRAAPRCGSGRTATAPARCRPGPTSTHMRCEKPSLAPMVVTTSRLGVELDLELAPVEVGDRAAELGDPARGRVAVVARVVGGLGQLAHGDVGRGQVGVPEAEVDDVLAGSPRRRLQVVDGGEDVGRQPVDPAELHRGSLRPGPAPPSTRAPPQGAAPRPPAPRRRPASRRRPRWHRPRCSAPPSRPTAATPSAAAPPRSPRPRRRRCPLGHQRRLGVPHVERSTGGTRLLRAPGRPAGDPHREAGVPQRRGPARPCRPDARPPAGTGCRRRGSPPRSSGRRSPVRR